MKRPLDALLLGVMLAPGVAFELDIDDDRDSGAFAAAERCCCCCCGCCWPELEKVRVDAVMGLLLRSRVSPKRALEPAVDPYDGPLVPIFEVDDEVAEYLVVGYRSSPADGLD